MKQNHTTCGKMTWAQLQHGRQGLDDHFALRVKITVFQKASAEVNRIRQLESDS